MAESKTNPITPGRVSHDPLQFYRGPLASTMRGYKLLSGTFLLCGVIAVPALLYTGQETGYAGAAAIGVASALPMTLQTIMVPHYVASMSLARPLPESASGMQTLSPRDQVRIQHFSFVGRLKITVEAIEELKPYASPRWINLQGKNGRKYYVDEHGTNAFTRRMMRMIEAPNDPKSWKYY